MPHPIIDKESTPQEVKKTCEQFAKAGFDKAKKSEDFEDLILDFQIPNHEIQDFIQSKMAIVHERCDEVAERYNNLFNSHTRSKQEYKDKFTTPLSKSNMQRMGVTATGILFSVIAIQQFDYTDVSPFTKTILITTFAVLLTTPVLLKISKTISALQELKEPLKKELQRFEDALDVTKKELEKEYKDRSSEELNKFIAGYRSPSYAETLNVKNWQGLSDVSQQELVVETGAVKGLYKLIETMKRGTIGVAGQRGAGKSTILERLTSSKNSKDVNLMVAAPIVYDARDFILHIFASMCYKVLESNGITRSDIADAEIPEKYEKADWSSVNPVLVILKDSLPWFFCLVGILLLIGVYWYATGLPAVQSTLAKSLLSPKGLPYFATGLFILGIILRLNQDEFWIAFANIPTQSKSERLISQSRNTSRVRSLLTESYRHLANIKFQQSFSRDWKGTLSLPYISSEKSNTTNLHLNQKTLPDVIEDFTRYTNSITEKLALNSSIVIAIDEMDKMKSIEDAHQFLNDIKAIFSNPNCLYLVSVSENAMGNFERRGLPFRDAFDSSFHEVVTIRYLNITESMDLLNRRVVGLSRPYQALCHSLSGGLARDLVRTARKLKNYARGTQLKDAKQAFFEEEIGRKVDAAIIRISELNSGSLFSTFVTRLKCLKTEPVSKRKNTIELLRGDMSKLKDDDEQTEGTQNSVVKLLCQEISTYVYFIDTLDRCLHFPKADRSKFDGYFKEDGLFDKLAFARQEIEQHIYLAWENITQLREARGLQVWTMKT